MKRTKVFLLLCMLICLLGCSTSNKVENYMEKGDYEQAKKIILEDKEKYGKYLDECNYHIAQKKYEEKDYITSYELLVDNEYKDANNLLKEIEPFYYNTKSIDLVKKEFNLIEEDQDKKNEGKNFNDTFVEGIDYYMDLGEKVHSLGDGTDFESKKNLYKELFEVEPSSQQEAKELINNINNYVVWSKDTYPMFYISQIFEKDEYCSSNRDNSKVEIKISNMYEFLKKHQISAKTFAYLLEYLSMYAPKYNFNKDDFVITWEKETRGYYCCGGVDNNSKTQEVEKWLENETKNINFKYIGKDINTETYQVKFTNNKFDFKIFATVMVYLNEDGYKVGEEFNKSEEIHKTNITYTWNMPYDAETYNLFIFYDTYD